MSVFYSHGKLLLTAEYIVLNGGLALALPTKPGQSLEISKADKGVLSWESWDPDGLWFSGEFTLEGISGKKGVGIAYDPALIAHPDIAHTLVSILSAAAELNPEFLSHQEGYHVKTALEFPRLWGLGSSSTLVNNIAHWAGVDPYQLLWNTIGGSGYDIACANSAHPILYRLRNETPSIETVSFAPAFTASLYFIYLNKKAHSNIAIENFETLAFDRLRVNTEIDAITNKMVHCDSLRDFEKLLEAHESIIAAVINQPTVKSQLFSDYKGAIKSLGAWGGDFILATGGADTPSYFKAKGYEVVIPYKKLILPIIH